MTQSKTIKILVTGGRGFLGSHVVENLIKKGYDQSLIYTPTREQYDLTRESDVIEMFKFYNPEIVIHIAGDIGGIGYSKNNPGKQLYNNLMMNTLVHHYAYVYGAKKFVGIGTVCSYPKFAKIPFSEDDLWSGYPEETNAAYGLSKKIMMEQSIAYRQQYNFNAIHLLLINLYGPRDNFNMSSSHVIPAMIRKIDNALTNHIDTIELWGDGTPTREFIFVEDAAEAIVLATELYNESNPVNIGTGIEISIRDLSENVAQLMGYNGRFIYDTSKPNGQPKRRLNVEKAFEKFGFKASIDFNEGLKRTIEWFYANKKIILEKEKNNN